MSPVIIYATMGAHEPVDLDVVAEVDRLVEAYRITCLWFLRPGYYPATDAERIRVLEQIERYGDLAAFRRAGTLRQWLSQTSSVESVGS